MNTLSGIQYLRAIAAIMVVFHHASLMVFGSNDGTQFGTAGVDIFFIISGFIMAYSTKGFVVGNDQLQQALHFFRRRVVRVVPLYWIALLWTTKAMFINNEVDLNILSDFLFFPRFYFHSHGAIWPELVVGWTLNYEMFFYLIFAISMLFGVWRYRVFSLVFLILILLGMLTKPTSAAIIFYTSSILLEFMLGVGVYFLSLKKAPNQNVVIIALLLAIFILVLDNGSIPRAVADGFPAAVIVYSTLILFNKTSFSLLNTLGDASYSIYLFHLGVFSLVGHMLRTLEWDIQVLPTVITLFLLVGLGVLTGLILNKVLEKPLLRYLRDKFEKKDLILKVS